MWKQISNKIADSRVAVSRILGVCIVLLALFTSHSFGQNSLIDILLETSGLFLLTVCSVGRLWSLLYISGYKRCELVTEGPYSITRNPLYFFSLIGAIGIGLASENVLILSLLLVFYLLYYPFTILIEERKLTDTFGQAYIDYAKRTPRFLPKLSLYKKPGQYQINADKFVRNLADGMWFVWIFIFFHFVEMLQNAGILPVLLKVP
jgi:protein-S-isoprenylcysteine O-methyltransferase Ste14